MTINQLLAQLKRAKDEIGGDCEVQLMTQPSYPMKYGLQGLIRSRDLRDDDDDDDDKRRKEVLFLVEGGHVGYGVESAWDRCD